MTMFDAGFHGLLKMSAHAALLIAFGVAVRWILRRHLPAGMVFGLWLLVGATLLVPWRAPLPAEWSERMIAMLLPSQPREESSLQPTMQAMPLAAMEPAVSNARRVAVASVVQPDFVRLGDRIFVQREYWGYAVMVWLYGMAVLFVLRVAAVVSFRRRLRRTARTAELKVERVVERCAAQLGLRRLPTVVTTSLVGSPALFGLWRPHLLMPPGLVEKLNVDELQWVVRHELAHLRRRDLWAQAGLQLACIVHWFNPLVWLAVRLARHDGELACDAWVLRRMSEGQSDAYGRTLLKVLSLASGPRSVPEAVGIVEGKRRLIDRIEMIARYRPMGTWRTVVGAMMLIGFMAAGFTQEASEKPSDPKADFPIVSGVNQAVPAVQPGLVRPPVDFRDVQRQKFKLNPELDAAFAAREKRREEWIANAVLELRAVGSVGGVPVAVIDVYGDPHVVVEGSQLFRRAVNGIGLATKQVTIRKVRVGPQSDPVEILRLEHPRKVDFPTIPPEAVNVRMKQSLNGASVYRQTLPGEVVHAWGKLNIEGKEAILMSYLRMGLVIDVHGDPDGRFSGTSTGQLFARRIVQIRRERMDAFMASLSEQQRKAFHNGGIPVINFTAPRKEQERQAKAGQKVIEDQKQVVAGLTPEQRKLYDAWQEFTYQPNGIAN